MSESTSLENKLQLQLRVGDQAHLNTLKNKETARPKARGRTVHLLFV